MLGSVPLFEEPSLLVVVVSAPSACATSETRSGIYLQPGSTSQAFGPAVCSPWAAEGAVFSPHWMRQGR